jgi:hypothetical protein
MYTGCASGKVMGRKRVRTSGLSNAVAALFLAPWPAKAQDAKARYPSMGSLEQYLMPDLNEEITLARTR